MRIKHVRQLAENKLWFDFRTFASAGKSTAESKSSKSEGSKKSSSKQSSKKASQDKKMAPKKEKRDADDKDGPSESKKAKTGGIVNPERVRELKGGDVKEGPVIYWYVFLHQFINYCNFFSGLQWQCRFLTVLPFCCLSQDSSNNIAASISYLNAPSQHIRRSTMLKPIAWRPGYAP